MRNTERVWSQPCLITWPPTREYSQFATSRETRREVRLIRRRDCNRRRKFRRSNIRKQTLVDCLQPIYIYMGIDLLVEHRRNKLVPKTPERRANYTIYGYVAMPDVRGPPWPTLVWRYVTIWTILHTPELLVLSRRSTKSWVKASGPHRAWCPSAARIPAPASGSHMACCTSAARITCFVLSPYTS